MRLKQHAPYVFILSAVLVLRTWCVHGMDNRVGTTTNPEQRSFIIAGATAHTAHVDSDFDDEEDVCAEEVEGVAARVTRLTKEKSKNKKGSTERYDTVVKRKWMRVSPYLIW